jgi:hypothetical protein
MTPVDGNRRRPLPGFFALACAISWGGILIAFVVSGFDLVLLALFPASSVTQGLAWQTAFAALLWATLAAVAPGIARRAAVTRLAVPALMGRSDLPNSVPTTVAGGRAGPGAPASHDAGCPSRPSMARQTARRIPRTDPCGQPQRPRPRRRLARCR